MTTSPTPPAPSSSAPRWMRVLLVVSLALNLLVAGLLIGDALAGKGLGRGPRPVEFALGPLARALPAEDRHAILESLSGDTDLRSIGREQMEAGLTAIAVALRTEPFDEARLRTAFATQAERVARGQQAVQEALLARLSAMDPATRAAIADRLIQDVRR